jgi:hypothetical protein
MATTEYTYNDYPESSCSCYKCTNKSYPLMCSGVPTNLGVYNCEVPSYFDCYDKLTFKKGQEPSSKQGWWYINPQAVTDKMPSMEFQQVKCNDPSNPNCKVGYVSSDPRLIDAVFGTTMILDTAPMDSSIKLGDIYDDPRLCNYGQGYRTYSDITAGDIVYYNDESIQGPFFEPNFVSTANVESYLYQDPMSALKPHYERTPLKCDNPMTNESTKFNYCLSWMQDSTEHREDIMSKQLAKTNQMRYAPRYFNNSCL